MRIHGIAKIKAIWPLTPTQARVNALKQSKDRAADALTAERNRQAQERVQKAQQALAKARLT